MRHLSPKHTVDCFRCPSCGAEELHALEQSVECCACATSFPIHHGVIDFVLHDRLGEEQKRELESMTVDLDDKDSIQWWVNKDKWDPTYTHFLKKGIHAAARFLAPYATAGRCLVTMGSGTGFELKALTSHVRFHKVLASDISWTASHVIAQSVEPFEGSLGRFACDFASCPVRRSPDNVCFIFEALHHCDDAYAVLEDLLANHFDALVMVEPIRNGFINLLARMGLAMRVEYSGLKPEWFDLKRISAIADRQGYMIDVVTWWPFPESIVPKAARGNRVLSAILRATVDAVTRITAPFRFGAMAAVHLRKPGVTP